ncbi:hypothetical protein DFQ05_2215 [Winogradskyella wandonensis]|uniref:Uncharacterized protein n=1 Tax=Winogradskyella wandonensis TaxID=1442586 RepID=A0A4R1KL04_9FLAO|nr:hypothetical protein [Winogradskyella wandonensis]TCK65003.1 hypothetical protein DFQ05_2215 [Winogradskyella wandonensis]
MRELFRKVPIWISLPLMLITWGYLGYEVSKGINPDLPEIPSATNIADFNPKPIAKTETFTISDIERDPFLGTLEKKVEHNSAPKKKAITPTKPINTPKVNFSGIVKNGKDQVFILTINGKQYLIRKGETVNDVKLVSGSSKQVVIRFNNTNTTILVD